MSKAIKILDGGQLEHGKVGRVDNKTWADSVGRLLADSGRTEQLLGWGTMDGTVRVLVDEFGDDAYYIR